MGQSWTNKARKLGMLCAVNLSLYLNCFAGVDQGEKKVTLNVVEENCVKVFKQIEKQTKMSFFYSTSDIRLPGKVSIKVVDAALDEVMGRILEGTNLEWIYTDNVITIRKKKGLAGGGNGMGSVADSNINMITVTGKVVQADGTPIPGATVRVKRSPNNGSTTDAAGNFALVNTRQNDVILISSIGYETREMPANGNTILVKLNIAVSGLDETVVIAYGTTTKRFNTGNVSSVKSKDIEKQPINNPLYALQGRVSGVIVKPTSGMPGAPVSIQIRGRNTLNPANKSEPLYIVDGLPYGNQIPDGTITPDLGALGVANSPFNFLNPNDIESIEILKDADATSIYGSRGANGVILITTKKGKAGKISTEINAQTGISKVSKKVNLLNTSQYLEMRKEGLKNDGWLDRLNDPAVYAEVYPDLLLWNQQKNTDWQQYLLGGTAKFTDLQGSISGGSENIQFIFGGNYHRETTVFPGTSSDTKGSGHLNIASSSGNKRLKSSLSVNYLIDRSNLPSADFTNLALTLPPNAPDSRKSDGSLNWDPGPSGLSTWYLIGDNPEASLERKYEIKQSNLITSGDISYSIFEGINLKSVIGYSETRGNSFRGVPSTSYDPVMAEMLGDYSRGASFSDNTIRNFNFTPQITFVKKTNFGTFDVLLGTEYQSTTTELNSVTAGGYTNDALLKNPAAATYITASSSSSQYKYHAVYGRITFNHKSKYLVNLNARRDGSSRFGPGKRFGNFGSVGLAYIFSEEKFVKERVPFLSFGKARLSYGTSGNDGSKDYMFLEQYQPDLVDLPYQGTRGYRTLGLFNNNYGWETTKKLEAGLDLGFINDRILLQFSYYRNRSDNQLVNYSYPSFIGFGNVLINFPALIQNSGLEIDVVANPIKSRNFNWQSSINLTISRNKLIEFPDLDKSSYATQFQIGNPFSGKVNAYNYDGVDPNTGQYQFLDVNGKVTSNPADRSRQDLGKYLRIITNPKYYGGFQNSITWMGFSIDFLLQFTKQLGRNPDYQPLISPGSWMENRTTGVLDRWQKPGDIKPFQRFTSRDNANGLRASYNSTIQSDQGYTDASFIRLKNASLSYNLPRKYVSTLGLQDVKVYLHSQNLFTVTSYRGLDPEIQSLADLPALRTITFGIKIGL